VAAVNLSLLPPILNTVKLPTLSALGNIPFNFEKLVISDSLTIRYQASIEFVVLGCFLVKSSNRLRVIYMHTF